MVLPENPSRNRVFLNLLTIGVSKSASNLVPSNRFTWVFTMEWFFWTFVKFERNLWFWHRNISINQGSRFLVTLWLHLVILRRQLFGSLKNKTPKPLLDNNLGAWIMCRRTELNCWHEDFQSSALPTELQRHGTRKFINRTVRIVNPHGKKERIYRYSKTYIIENSNWDSFTYSVLPEKKQLEQNTHRQYISQLHSSINTLL